MTVLNTLFGRTRALINEDERVLHIWKGQIVDVLRPGEHTLASTRGRLLIERHNLARPEFISVFEKAIFEKLPDAFYRLWLGFRAPKS